MPSAALVIPFRDRGHDPLRAANLRRVLGWWKSAGVFVNVVSDGRDGDQQFNRSAAYNRGAELAANADVIVYTEADMLIPFEQIAEGIRLAAQTPGLVVPFDLYAYLSPEDSERVRNGEDPAGFTPEKTIANGRSIGAVNIVSRETLTLMGGYSEQTEGSWYDDRIAQRQAEVCAGPTHWIAGPAYHLYHLPGWTGTHLSDEDKAATARNRALWRHVKGLSTPDRMRAALHQ